MFTDQAKQLAEADATAEQLQRLQARLDALARFSVAIGGAGSEAELLERVAQHAPPILGVPRFSIALVDDNAPTFGVARLAGDGAGVLMSEGDHMLIPGTAVGEAVDNGTIVTTFDFARNHFTDWAYLANMGLRWFIVVPMRVGGSYIGTLNLGAPEPRPFAQHDIHFGKQVAAAITAEYERLRG